MEKEMNGMRGVIKKFKEKIKKDTKKESALRRRQLQNVKVRFHTHTTNVYQSTSIQPSAVLMPSDSLPKFTTL
jgi:hypothetical protein